MVFNENTNYDFILFTKQGRTQNTNYDFILLSKQGRTQLIIQLN